MDRVKIILSLQGSPVLQPALSVPGVIAGFLVAELHLPWLRDLPRPMQAFLGGTEPTSGRILVDCQRSQKSAIAIILLLLVCSRDIAAAARPRLFFTPEKIERLQRRAESDTTVRSAWRKLRERADRLLQEQLVSKEYAESGRGQHGNYGRPSNQVSRSAAALGLAYRMTGEQRYAEKLRDALLHYSGFNRWAGDAHHDPPWHSELNTARFCFGFAVGYDSVHDFLTETDRTTIREAMIRLGILPTLNDWVLSEQRIHALDSMGHNWWSVCVAMAGLAALSLLGDEPRAESWIRDVSDAFPEWFAYSGNVLQNKCANFDRNGAFYESVAYANYALSEYLLFRLAYLNCFPDTPPPAIPVLETAGDFFVQTCYPRSGSTLSLNFGDTSLSANGSRSVRLLRANGFDKEEYRWYLRRTDAGLEDPIGLVYHEGNLDGAAPARLPTSAVYPDIGWVVMRSSWEDDATLLAVKSGYAWNHAHADAGSFILFHGGQPLIIDSGNCPYSRREYTAYYRHSRAHNVILFNGQAGHPEDCGNGDRGVKTPGRVHRLLDAAGLRYVFADATGPTAWRFARNYRHFLWLGDVILILGDVRAYEKGTFEWLLHYEGRVKQEAGTLTLSNGETSSAVVHSLFPENMTVTEKTGLKDHAPDTEVTYLALSPQEPTRETKFITAVLPVDPAGEATVPALERLRGGDMIGVRIRQNETVTDVYLNLRADGRKMHRNSCNTIDGWETDAYIFAVTRAAGADRNDVDAVARYFVACGSYLRRNGTVVLGSLSKVFCLFTPGNQTMEVALKGQPLMNVSLRAPQKPRTVILNGRVQPVIYDHERTTVRLDAGGMRSRPR